MATFGATLLVLLLVTVGGDAFLPIISFYPDVQAAGTGMPCRWYNMPAYANVISPSVGYTRSSGGLGLDLDSIDGLEGMLSRLYPQSIAGSSATRPRVVVRVEESNTPRNRAGVVTVTAPPGRGGNRELDYFEGGEYYDDEDGYYYDYSDRDGYEDTVTYFEMPPVSPTGNILQTWYGSGVDTSANFGNMDQCKVCAASRVLGFLMG